ncbi:TonB-dependent receptor [Maribacter sp. 2-571]|uniref:TonB-dependent receptor n=1 Tax=Maribacter sp. 2-571 TaxID=3417569 RepID=UPI003D32AA4A
MPKTPPRLPKVFLYVLLLLVFSYGRAQEAGDVTALFSFLQELEQRFDIKLSYVDADIQDLNITVPEFTDLETALSAITQQTQLRIEKLNDRYYTLTKSELIAICGQVLDNFKENTVPGATVEVLPRSKSLVTDSEGRFSISGISRKSILQIKFFGFKTLFVAAEKLVSNAPCQTLLLTPFYNQLEEVVVYEFLTAGLVQQADASILLNTNEFGILPGAMEPDILQTIQALPGVKSIDETVSDINIRGGSNDQNLLLWDGIKMYQSGHFFGLISAFNPYLTDKVTLIKNGSSAVYGDGVSGIIDMRTKNKLENAFFGGAGFNMINGDVYGQLPINDDMAFQFSARRSLTDFFNTPTYSEFSSRAFQDSQVVEQEADFYFYDFSSKFLYDIGTKHQLRASVININNRLAYSRLTTGSAESTESELDQTNTSFGGHFTSTWSDRFSTDLNVYRTDYELGANNSYPDPQQRLVQVNKVEETGAKLITELQVGTVATLRNGYQFTETGIANQALVTQPPFDSNVKRIMRAHAVFSEFSYTSEDKKLFANAGLRLNYYQNPDSFEEFIPEPRLNLNYTFAPNWKVVGLGEFKSQVTNQIIDLEQNFLGVEKRRWIISDGETLPVTTSKQASLGLNFDTKEFYAGIEGFFKEVKGVSTATQGFQNQNQFNGEIGQYTIRGVELLINRKTENYSVWGSYSYNLNTYFFPELMPSEFPHNLDVRHVATLAGTYTLGPLKMALGLNYRTGKPFTEPAATDPLDTSFFPNRINYAEANSSRLPEYLRADFSAMYAFELTPEIAATVGASVLNITDRKNIFNRFYRIDTEGEIEKVENVALGLTPNLSFRVRF